MKSKILRYKDGGAVLYTNSPCFGETFWQQVLFLPEVGDLADDELQRLFGAELRALALKAEIEDET